MTNDPLFVRLYLDEDVHPDLADALRNAGFDTHTVPEAGRSGKTDEEQLEYAASQGRCIMSFNVADYAILAVEWAKAGKAHSGIVVTQQVGRKAFGQLLARSVQFLNTTTSDEMLNVFRYL